ncbi:RluA family pseudouridine synthase [Aquibacillus saliphilus]|uniref:RluA family pseudouridine synthase n=1 Tax=Aquibacillus saliphilus TaxID=1909422 RepID=UPI003F700990
MIWAISMEHNGMLVKDYLMSVQGFSRRLLKAVKFQGGSILVNGENATVRRVLMVGDEIAIVLPEETKGTFMEAENLPLEIVYEDNDVLVINKPAKIASIPSLHHSSGTIANGILGYYRAHNLTYTVHIVTRLDRDTSGLLLVAKHRFSHSLLSKDQKQGKVNRSYYAIIEGYFTGTQGTIDAPIGRRENSIIERMVRDDGQRAVTHYKLMMEAGQFSLLDVKLETGRTHQIRVHFSNLGYPLVGDDLYGGNNDKINRQSLHCKTLEFTQPMTKERLSFKCEMPQDMRELLK